MARPSDAQSPASSEASGGTADDPQDAAMTDSGAPGDGQEPRRPGAEEETPWWQDEGMPWHSKPGKADYWCLGWIGFLGIFSLAMLPLKGWLLGLDPPVMMGISGSRIGAAATGALAEAGKAPFWWAWLLLGSVMSIKLDWVYWWAGKLWGRGIIEVWAGSSARARKRYDRAERWAGKLGWLGIIVAYVPIPLPIMPVVFVLTGASRMPLKWFLALDFIAATLWNGGFIAAGWLIGAPIVDVLHQYNRIVSYVTVALCLIVIVPIFFRSSKKDGAAKK
ncbi:Membrane-associated protein [Acidipropionibacterium acidipropionici ATCC 4875]|jgi:membrane protein DedA with SNARE-associated domain|uniref:Membrane-associated protein n=2 Tax=Acidipropionibacterium acidipropionici TaxID=1748 RepID=K7SHF3_ACIA4|nr:Membrane-associated protein [Acidipropionibacterium acidipropionici ATCC 4875]ALN13984.1 hypothetical protein ASQ49_00550 [Acidipropionibacterium acidipropionici]APZ10250.1 hypothetical protein BWX38_14420 [Acidipropionibacterium acidipropionici]